MVKKSSVPREPCFQILPELQGVLGEDNQKVFAKVSMNLGKKWARTIETPIDIDELMEKIAKHLQGEFQLAEIVKFVKEDQYYVLEVRGCNVCHGKLVRERFGITAACSISLFPVGAMFALGAVKAIFKVKMVKLKKIRKTGSPGDCDLIYEITI